MKNSLGYDSLTRAIEKREELQLSFLESIKDDLKFILALKDWEVCEKVLKINIESLEKRCVDQRNFIKKVSNLKKEP